jgi:hypothetical protein
MYIKYEIMVLNIKIYILFMLRLEGYIGKQIRKQNKMLMANSHKNIVPPPSVPISS